MFGASLCPSSGEQECALPHMVFCTGCVGCGCVELGRFVFIASLLTPRSRVLLEKLTSSQPVKKFPAFYGTRRFITAFTRARYCPYPEPARSSPCPSTSRFLKYILILSSHLCLGLPSGLFPSLFPTKSLYAPLISPIRGTCPAPLCTRASVQVPDVLLVSQHDSFYGEELLAIRPTPQAGRSPLVGFPQLLIQYIRSYPPYYRRFLHPQPEHAPFSGDSDPLIMGMR